MKIIKINLWNHPGSFRCSLRTLTFHHFHARIKSINNVLIRIGHVFICDCSVRFRFDFHYYHTYLFFTNYACLIRLIKRMSWLGNGPLMHVTAVLYQIFFFYLIVLLVFIKRNIKVIKDKFQMLAKLPKAITWFGNNAIRSRDVCNQKKFSAKYQATHFIKLFDIFYLTVCLLNLLSYLLVDKQTHTQTNKQTNNPAQVKCDMAEVNIMRLKLCWCSRNQFIKHATFFII